MSRYGEIVKLREDVRNVESWNLTGGRRFDLAAGTMVMVRHEYDRTHTVLSLVSVFGSPCHHPEHASAYRFIVPNADLNQACPGCVPAETDDLVGAIMAVEDGTASAEQADLVFSSPICDKLQGWFGRQKRERLTT